jgi:hypothetical protein
MRTPTLIGLLLCAGALRAADVQPRTAPAPGAGAGGVPAAPRPPAPPEVERTWLGVVVSQASPTLAHQLGLAAGAGLQVERVVPDSPAAAAGIEQYDVLVRLGDQLLVNQQQLEVVLDTNADGARTTVQLMRQAKERTLEVVLRRRMMPRDRTMPVPWQALGPDEGLRALPPHLRGMIARLPDAGPGMGPLMLQYVLPPSVSVSDGDARVTWQAADDGEQVEVRDGAGNVVFHGTAAEAGARTDLPPFAGQLLQQPAPAPGLPAPAAGPAPAVR